VNFFWRYLSLFNNWF